MAQSLIVETGAGVAGANSYCAVADCDQWHLARALDYWPPAPEPNPAPYPLRPLGGLPAVGTDDPNLAKKAASLIQATDFLNGLRWRGKKVDPSRYMAWPREGAKDRDGAEMPVNSVPEAVRNACCYMAGLSYKGVELLPIIERGERIHSESVGSLSVSYFDDGAAQDIYTRLLGLLRGLALGLEDDSVGVITTYRG